MNKQEMIEQIGSLVAEHLPEKAEAIGNASEVTPVVVRDTVTAWAEAVNKQRLDKIFESLKERDEKYIAQVFGVTALYEAGAVTSWAHAGQAVGLGKAREQSSGASTARTRYLEGEGKPSEKGSAATKLAKERRSELAPKFSTEDPEGDAPEEEGEES